MTMSNAVEQAVTTDGAVKAKISAILRVKPERLTDERPLAELVADSFSLVEMSVELQEEFAVRLPQGALNKVKTVGDLVQLVLKSIK
jgi:acyl carrier protein